MGRLFTEDKTVDLTPILRKSKEAARKHRTKTGGSKSGPLGGRNRVVRGGLRGRGRETGRGRGGDRGRRRPQYENVGGGGKFPRYEDKRGPPRVRNK